MIHRTLLLLVMMAALMATALAQSQDHSGRKRSTAAAKRVEAVFSDVLKQPLTDPELKDYELRASVMHLPPGFLETVKHRHDAELFGYVLEGAVEVQLDKPTPGVYQQGQMFYEPFNILHASLKNQSGSRSARILLIFVIKKGRSDYIAEPVK